MKRIKKLASLLLAMVMVLAMGTTVFAAEADPQPETGSITISDVKEGAVYNIYRIFDLESYDKEKDLYSYKVNAAWNGFFAEGAVGRNYVDISDTGYVTWKQDVDKTAAAELAKEALAYAKENLIEVAKTTAPAENDGNIVVDGLPLGYYLLDSTVGTLCSLNTTNPDVTIEDKNLEPTNEKEVEEDSTTTYGKEDDADIGQTVNFKSTITAQEGAQNYIFHDKMSAGLTFGEVTGITLNDDLVDVANYEVKSGDAIEDGCTFEVVFTKAFCDALAANDSIVISYSATLNENAVIAGEGNPNESKLTYGENNEFETKPSKTETFTWKFEVFKYVLDGGDKKALAEAEFTLSKAADGSNPIAFVEKGKDADGNPIYQVAADSTAQGVSTTIITDETGTFVLQGLDADTYYLTETKSPDGYNELAAPVKVVIDNEGNVTADGSVVDKVEVENKAGSLLPSTGGIGTTIFYVIGGILVVAAGVLLVTKKRMKAE